MDAGLVPGNVVAGRYTLETLIGKGGFAEVWRARHVALQSHVAIKFLLGTSAQSESIRRRFTTEAQIAAQLKSQNAVQVFDFGFADDDRPFLVMELLEGETLGRRLERVGRLDTFETARLLGQSSRALHRAHQLGIVHRDFKPDNVVIASDDEGRDYAKVLDFGIAKLVGDLDAAAGATGGDLTAEPSNVTGTKAGAVLGTPFYMAPEQVRNAAEVDLRADVWAFGVVAFECLTGRLPFTGKDLFELFDRIRSGSHTKAIELEPSVPPAFDDWFAQACASDPNDRFADTQAAYKTLLTALGVGRIDLDPSLVRRREEPLGPRVVVPGTHEGVDARTVDADEKRGIDARHRSVGAHDSFRKLTLARPVSMRPPGPSDVAVSHTLRDEALPAKQPDDSSIIEAPAPSGAPRRRWPLVALGIASVGALVVWRATTTGDATRPVAPPASTAPVNTPPIASAAPVPDAVAPTEVAPAATVAVPSALVAPPIAPGSRVAPPAAQRHVASAASSAPAPPRPTPSAAPTASPVQPAPSAPTDPGSYR